MHTTQGSQPSTYRAVILTALPVEYRAVRAHLTDLREEVHSEGTVYEQGRFSSEKAVWDVLIGEFGAGNPRAAFETERALAHFKPHVALFVGVAGGLKDVAIGDVVFAPKVYFYESAKVQAGLKLRPDGGESSYALVQRARAEARKEEWLRRLIGSVTSNVPRALAGPLAAGEKVLADVRTELYQLLRSHYEDALAVEMEGRGFLMAAHAHRHVEALVIRGISDRLDDKAQADAAGSQELASRHASAFAFQLLAHFVPPGVELALTQPRVEEQGTLWSVPYPRNPHFTGRDDLLRNIRAHFLSDTSPSPMALHGLGGVGKTQLALEYASRYDSDEYHYSHVLWLRADEQAVLASSYAGLADVLELPETAEKEQAQKIEAVRRWLQQHERWLLVFDNAAQPEALTPYLPSTFKGHILITSRNPAWGQLAKPCLVEVLEPAACVEFLRKRTGQDDPAAATLLAIALGGLPLALAQAAAYIEQTGKVLADYLRLFEQRQKELLARPGAPTGYPNPVATTWEISFEQVQAQAPEGAALLSLCAFLASSPIPIALLKAGSELLPAPLSATLTDEVRWDELLGTLRRYSLVQVHHEHLLFHTLVQVVMRGRLANGSSLWAETALGLIHQFFDFDAQDTASWPRCAILFPHAYEAARHAWQFKTGLKLLPKLLVSIGHFWEEQAEYSFAMYVLNWAVEALQHTPGFPLLQEAELWHRLGVVALESGALDEAQKHLEHAQTLIQRVPRGAAQLQSTAILLGDIAVLAVKRGRFQEARTHAEKALALLESTVDGDDPLIGHAASTLGSILERQADFEQARVQLERALAISQRHFGHDHLKTAVDLHNLGGVLKELGRYAEAKRHYEHALALTERIYGPEHPRVASFLRALGSLHQRLGNLEAARACCERSLSIDEERLGPEHMNVGLDLNDLARVLHAQGDFAGARAFLERALALEERVFGPEHPELASSLDNLGQIQQEQGEYEQARISFTRALAMQERIHGPAHPRVANALNNLGVLLMHMNELPQARSCLERAVAIDEKAYGLEHPEVATDLANLASVLIRQGDKTQARERLERALSIHDKHIELPASEAFYYAFALGKTHHEFCEWASARDYLERALGLLERCPEGEPQRFELLLLLGSSLRSMEEYAQAIICLEKARLLPGEGRNPLWLGNLLLLLGTCYRELEQTDQSSVNLEAAKQIAESAGDKPLLSHVRFELGRLARQKREFPTARQYVEQVWEQRSEAELGRPDTVLIELGCILEALQDLTGARGRFEEALRFAEAIRGPDSSAVATCATHLGRVLCRSGSPSEACPYLERALAIRERVAGALSFPVAQTVQYLAEAKLFSLQLPAAEVNARRALSIYSASESPPRNELTEALIILGTIHRRAGDLQGAGAAFERALSLQESPPRTRESELVSLLSMLGDVYTLQGAFSKAKAALERALRGANEFARPQPQLRTDLTRKLGDLCKAEGDLTGARTYFTRAVEIQASLSTSGSLLLAADRLKLANVLRLLQEHALALGLAEQVLNALEMEPQVAALMAQAFMLRGEILLAMANWEQARSSFEWVLEHAPPDIFPPGHMSNLHHNLGVVFMNLGFSKRALLHLERALPLAAKAYGSEHPEYAIVVANIGMLFAKIGRRAEAVKKLKRALAIFAQQDGPEHPAAQQIRQELEQLSH